MTDTAEQRVSKKTNKPPLFKVKKIIRLQT